MRHDRIPTCHGGKGMILEKETYEKFGYYPGNLKPKSGKKILVACDDCGKIRELRKDHHSDFCRFCVKKGKKNPFYGKHHSENTKRKMSDARKGERNPRFGKHHREDAKQKIRGENNPRWNGGKVKRICKICGTIFEVDHYRIKYGFGKFCSHSCTITATRRKGHLKPHPKKTRPEIIFETICKKYNIPFKYTGDGGIWIGEKGEKRLNPDFIETNGKKICIEIMGAWWHSPLLLNQNLREEALQSYREIHYKKYKWIPVFIWDTDLLRKDAEQFVLNEMKK